MIANVLQMQEHTIVKRINIAGEIIHVIHMQNAQHRIQIKLLPMIVNVLPHLLVQNVRLINIVLVVVIITVEIFH